MRIVLKLAAASTGPCENNITGEVEDYNILITGTASSGCTVAPTLTSCPTPSINVQSMSTTAGIAVNYNVTATSNCGGTITYTNNSPASGSVFPIGSTPITVTVKDQYNNASVCSFSINVSAATTGGSTTPTLQQVTSAGNTTSTNTVFSGKVAVGTAAPNFALDLGAYSLLVKGGVRTERVKIDLSSSAGWADFVFKPTYKLPKLETVEQFIKENGHLPNIPSTAEIEKNGLDLGAMDAKLLQKIEELTLYILEMKKEIMQLKKEITQLKK